MRLLFLVNPASGGKRGERRWNRIEAILRDRGIEYEVAFTRRIHEATELTERSLREEIYNTIVAVGGDGTINEVINGFFDKDGEPITRDTAFSFIPVGTGCDFAKTFSCDLDWKIFLDAALKDERRFVDAGMVEFHDGRHFFINIAGAGIESYVVARVNRSRKLLGGRLSFLGATLRTILSYRPVEMRIELDGKSFFEGRVMNVAVANGRYFGGGMKIAPEADPSDGLFDCILIEPAGIFDTLRGLKRLYEGSHNVLPQVHIKRAERVVIDCESPIPVDLDGEDMGSLPATFTVLKSALLVRLP